VPVTIAGFRSSVATTGFGCPAVRTTAGTDSDAAFFFLGRRWSR
jgi:hypothetical protein